MKKIKNKIYKNELAVKYFTEKQVRDTASIYNGIVLDSLMAVFKIIMGICYRSYWLLATAVYHVTLGFMHVMLLKKEWVREENEAQRFEKEELQRIYQLRSYRFCGNLMFFLNVAMSGMAILMIWKGEHVTYPGYTVYAFATYAFYCLTTAIINWVKYRKKENPVFSASKNIKLAKALMSLFTLQTVLLEQFGADMAADVKMLMNSLTGLVVCAAVFAIAVMMVVNATDEIRRIKKEL